MERHKKLLMINTVLLLGVAVIFFRIYLPVTEEIADLNQQLQSLETQIDMLKRSSDGKKLSGQSKGQEIAALPEDEMEHLSQELAVLASKHGMTLIQIEPGLEQAEMVSRLKIKLSPYVMGFSGKNPQQFSELLANLESTFPELAIQTFSYDKNMGMVDAKLVTSSQSVRLFAP